MYRISQLAESVGLSRATLLYYEKLGLLKGKRQANGYRLYTEADRQRLQLLQQLQAGGLSPIAQWRIATWTLSRISSPTPRPLRRSSRRLSRPRKGQGKGP
ncbi:MAG: hypothetical protein CMJ42_08950 [Phyllobacteriaceae bacterium]|nr:hypothetical protein [Phyllobacteriaceae bacterium]MBA89893.1 hypothetical protein [Phyllobacteriaceae bacterium]